jgi:hypothetical protein
MSAWPRSILSILIVLISCGTALSQDDPTQDIQSLALQWTNLERQRNVLASNWREEQPVLEQQLSLLQRERDELTDFLEQTEAAQDEVEERRLELLERQSELEQEQSLIDRELESAIVQVRGVFRQLPPPMVNAWQAPLADLQEDFRTSSERLQILVEMLGELDDFHRRLSLFEEVMTLADGQEYLVKQVYLGLSQGWYVSANGLFAGIGHPGTNGWQWQSSDEPETIDRVVDILERRRNAELVTLSVELGDAGLR